MRLHALVDKWRAESTRLRELAKQALNEGRERWGDTAIEYAKSRKTCADELAAALAAGDGAVAWTSQNSLDMLSECGTGIMGVSRTDYICVPLFTHPASPTSVECTRNCDCVGECKQPQKVDPIPMQVELGARIWKRESTHEWVLEIYGSVNDTDLICRHAEPLTTRIDDVASLPSLYAKTNSQAQAGAELPGRTRNEAFNLADTVIEHMQCGREHEARKAIMEAFRNG